MEAPKSVESFLWPPRDPDDPEGRFNDSIEVELVDEATTLALYGGKHLVSITTYSGDVSGVDMPYSDAHDLADWIKVNVPTG